MESVSGREGFQWYSIFLHGKLYQHKKVNWKLKIISCKWTIKEKKNKNNRHVSKQNHFTEKSLLPFIYSSWVKFCLLLKERGRQCCLVLDISLRHLLDQCLLLNISFSAGLKYRSQVIVYQDRKHPKHSQKPTLGPTRPKQKLFTPKVSFHECLGHLPYRQNNDLWHVTCTLAPPSLFPSLRFFKVIMSSSF